MGVLDFAVQLGRTAPDISMTDTYVFDVPVEFRLEFMTSVGPGFANAKRKGFDDVIDSHFLKLPFIVFTSAAIYR